MTCGVCVSQAGRGVLTLKSWFRPRNPPTAGPHVITYRATLDVPAATVYQVSRWLSAYRKAHDVRPWQRAATSYVQAVMVLRWFKDATDLRLLARDGRVSIATAYNRPDIAGGEALAGLLRKGTPGSNTAIDHITVLEIALQRCLTTHARSSTTRHRSLGRSTAAGSFGFSRCDTCVRGSLCRAWRELLVRIPRRCADPAHRRSHSRGVLASRDPDRRRPARRGVGG